MAAETPLTQIRNERRSILRNEKVFLPICCLCGLLRDERGHAVNGQNWVTRRMFRKTRSVKPSHCILTHTYCPGCFTKVMEAMSAAVISESLSVPSGILSGRTLRTALRGTSHTTEPRVEGKQAIALA